MVAAERFSRKLLWALLGPYAVFFGGALVVALIRFFVNHFFTTWLVLAWAIALLVQVVAVFLAIGLLALDRRYRSWWNIALTVAGIIPITYIVLSAMIFGVRFHM